MVIVGIAVHVPYPENSIPVSLSSVIIARAVTVTGHTQFSVIVGGVVLEYLVPGSVIFRLSLKLVGSNWSVAIAFEVGGSMLKVGIFVHFPLNVMLTSLPFSIFEVADKPSGQTPPVLVISGA